MSEWDARAGYYRQSRTHACGADLDQVVAWCEPGPGVAALDVASGGGHVARRLRELGCVVTTADAAAGMEPDVVCPAEHLPFADGSFDVVVCRLAVHHFQDPALAVLEMARVTRRLVVIEDTLFIDDRVQQAERLRDATHVSHYGRDELGRFLAAASLRPVAEVQFPTRHDIDDWLSATGCAGDTAARVRRLLAHVSSADGRTWTDTKIVLKAAKDERR
jgi:SAM-dependent methyltransferase